MWYSRLKSFVCLVVLKKTGFCFIKSQSGSRDGSKSEAIIISMSLSLTGEGVGNGGEKGVELVGSRDGSKREAIILSMSASLMAEGVGGCLDKGVELDGAETSSVVESKKASSISFSNSELERDGRRGTDGNTMDED